LAKDAFSSAPCLHLSILIAIQDFQDTNPRYSPAKKSLPAIAPFANPKCNWQKQRILIVNESLRLGRAVIHAVRVVTIARHRGHTPPMLGPRETMNGGDVSHRSVSIS
jgi:hypothetical protein